MPIPMMSVWRRAAAWCGTAARNTMELARAWPGQFPVLIHIFGMDDLSQPRR
ncbi:hypothetical protein [Caballeronia sp. GAFFF2]|uniref:hypothetical protein n=1 Tax=Caballeronia sp. GAFFF2 TaxID=2921741 RepID=UPI002027C537|nr:hypothetical protein [Caballeronia sp. GAFFF2]